MIRSLIEEQVDVFLGDTEASDLVQASIGQREEYEHTDDPEEALSIALTHLNEDPDYYLKLMPASAREGYQIDFVCTATRHGALYYASLVSADRGKTWAVQTLYILEGSNEAPIYAMDILAEALKACSKSTYYECFVGRSEQRLAFDEFWNSITNKTGYSGLHTDVGFVTTPLEFLNAVRRSTTSIDHRISLF